MAKKNAPKDIIKDLVKLYQHIDQSDGTTPYRDIVTDVLHVAKENLKLPKNELISKITSSAEEVFKVEDL